MKYLVTFGSDHLKAFNVNPLKVGLVIEGDSEFGARDKYLINNSDIGRAFCTTYPYSKFEEFKEKYGMKEYTLEELEKYRHGNKTTDR